MRTRCCRWYYDAFGCKHEVVAILRVSDALAAGAISPSPLASAPLVLVLRACICFILSLLFGVLFLVLMVLVGALPDHESDWQDNRVYTYILLVG